MSRGRLGSGQMLLRLGTGQRNLVSFVIAYTRCLDAKNRRISSRNQFIPHSSSARGCVSGPAAVA